MGKERPVLDEVADAAPVSWNVDFLRGVEDSVAVDRYAAAVGLSETRNRFERQSLAGTGIAEQRDKLPSRLRGSRQG